jgi:erythritol transport system substrate-binding protein
VITPSISNRFFFAEQNGAVAEAHRLGYKTQAFSHDDNNDRQDQLVDDAIAQHAAAIILEPVHNVSSVATVQRAANAGIGVFLLRYLIYPSGVAKAQIKLDENTGATLQAVELARLMGNTGEYAELLGDPAYMESGIRSAVYHNVLDKIPSLTMVSQEVAYWDTDTAEKKTKEILGSHPNIKGIIAANDAMALGAVNALKAAGRNDVAVVGFDGAQEAIQAILEGSLKATVLQPIAETAKLAMDEADQWIRTGSTGQPERQLIECTFVTPANASQVTGW